MSYELTDMRYIKMGPAQSGGNTVQQLGHIVMDAKIEKQIFLKLQDTFM